MCNYEWDAIAEFYLQTEDFSVNEEIYCVCSRVFTWNNICEDQSESEGDCSKQNTDIIKAPFLECTETKNCNDGEPVSCYCSASHTDNISTDEHDSLYDSHSTTQQALVKTLHLSDSGTDLTDHIKRNSDTWQNYWARNGERLIWESWITKYSDYIDPEYLQEKTNNQIPIYKDLPINETSLEKNRILIRNLSCSDSYDKLHQEEGEGWNRLSPVSIECETEAERLLSSRCPSQTGSSVPTLDSMTNVTQLTLSSVDLSESSKNSEGLSSVSSIQSSITSSSSVDIDESGNYSLHWNELWSQHYEEVYALYYHRFLNGEVDELRIMENTFEKDLSKSEGHSIHKDVCDSTTKENRQNLLTPNVSPKRRRKRSKLKISVSKVVATSSTDELCTSAISTSVQADLAELKEMELLGLPLKFSSLKKDKSLQKRSADCDSRIDQDTAKRIKSVFNLIGIKMDEESTKPLLGTAEYEVQHIRAQNRILKLHDFPKPTGKHIHFDDNGQPISETISEINESVEDLQNNDLSALLASTTEEEEPELPILQKSQVSSNKQKKKRKRKSLPAELSEKNLSKYWHKRYSLFSRFDEGIKLDTESWFSVTPEQIAVHTAERCRCDIIIDAFCGAGGNAIQFALTCNKVIAIDIDPKKIELAKHNAQIYNVVDHIEFIIGDFYKLAKSLQGDVVFLSPPWGGPQYLKNCSYDLELLQPAPFSTLFQTASKISSNIGIFLPRNSNTYPLIMAAGPGGQMEVEQNFLGKRLVAITAYYGELVNTPASNN